MIITEKAVERRIKRANTDWWINEKSVVGLNGKTYIAYYTDMGEIHVKELDAKCRGALSKDVCICRLNTFYSDEHNSPSICIMNSGRIIVVYTGHAATNALRYRVTEKPYDLDSFGPEKALDYQYSVTYAQLFENTRRNELWLFTRVNSVTWEFRVSKDEGENWNNPVTFLKSDAGGLFYFDIRKILYTDNAGVEERWTFALYGHPRISKDHTIRSGYFDENGTLHKMNGEETEMNLFGVKSTQELDLPSLEVVYESPEGTTVRLLEVSPTLPYRVGLATFELNKPETITYHMATYWDDKWTLSEPICSGGEFLSVPPQLDGSQTYVGGMACYYGVGYRGFHKNAYREVEGRPETMFKDSINTDRVFIARFNGVARVLESYVSMDFGRTYQLEQVIRSIPDSEEKVKIWRPVVPIYAQDNLPVYWHEGIYSAHTGGWHCDVVMFVEYDD